LNYTRRRHLPAHQFFDVISDTVRRVDQKHIDPLEDITPRDATNAMTEQRRDRRDCRPELLGDISEAVPPMSPAT
jgi:hypothetical protein